MHLINSELKIKINLTNNMITLKLVHAFWGVWKLFSAACVIIYLPDVWYFSQNKNCMYYNFLFLSIVVNKAKHDHWCSNMWRQAYLQPPVSILAQLIVYNYLNTWHRVAVYFDRSMKWVYSSFGDHNTSSSLTYEKKM